MDFAEYMGHRFTEAGIGILFVLVIGVVFLVAKLAIDIKQKQKERRRKK